MEIPKYLTVNNKHDIDTSFCFNRKNTINSIKHISINHIINYKNVYEHKITMPFVIL